MKSLKYKILFLILFITVGIAAVSTNVIINGSTSISSNPDDFLVYFSDVLVNGTQDLSLVESETSLVFDGEFSAVGDKKEITYDVTNASKNYDADIDITCTQSTTYLTITNTFDTSSNLSATSTRTGVLSITLNKSYTGADLTQDISCTISASAVERTNQGSGSVAEPLKGSFKVGDEISIGEEKFNVIGTTDATVTMLAQQNISDAEPYKQTSTQVWTVFGGGAIGWEYTPGPKEVDIQTWGGDVNTLLNNYVVYLNTEYGISVTGELITLSKLGELGCKISSDYSYGTGGWNCTGSENSDWLITHQYWWTRSAYSDNQNNVWIMDSSGSLKSQTFAVSGVRPVITISKSLLN